MTADTGFDGGRVESLPPLPKKKQERKKERAHACEWNLPQERELYEGKYERLN